MEFRLTADYLNMKFNEYNAKYFDSMLSGATLVVSHTKNLLGRCGHKVIGGKRVHLIEVSDYFVRPEDEICNTLLHEMIHYYIQQFGLSDSSPHGRIFKSMAERINEFGWHISTHGSVRGCETRKKVEYKLIALEYCNAYYVVRMSDFSLASYARSLGCKGIVKFLSTDSKEYGSLRVCRKRLMGRFISKAEYDRIARMCE